MFWKIVLSVFVVFIAMLVAAAGSELTSGETQSGFVPMIVLVIAGPILHLIWRKRPAKPGQEKLTREEMMSGLRRMIDDPDTPQEMRDAAAARLGLLDKSKA